MSIRYSSKIHRCTQYLANGKKLFRVFNNLDKAYEKEALLNNLNETVWDGKEQFKSMQSQKSRVCIKIESKFDQGLQ